MVVIELDKAQIQHSLIIPTEVDFWQIYFPLKPKVNFQIFVEKLFNHYNLKNNSYLQCDFYPSLNIVIGDSTAIPSSNVTIHAYKKLIGWFGPLFTGQNFLHFYKTMKKIPEWFFVNIDKGTDAEKRLGPKPGKFIVRLTPDILLPDRQNLPFTLDYYDNGFIHHRITRVNGRLHIQFNNKVYEKECLVDLIEDLMHTFPSVFSSWPSEGPTPSTDYVVNNIISTQTLLHIGDGADQPN